MNRAPTAGKPSDVAAAEKLIAEGSPLSSLFPLFKNRDDAAMYYARRHQALHAPDMIPPECCACGSESSPQLLQFRWEAIKGRWAPRWTDLLWFFAGFISVGQRITKVEFVTHHILCVRCSRAFRVRRAFAFLLQFVGLFIVVLGLLVVPSFLLMPFFLKVKPGEMRTHIMTNLVILTVFSLGIVCLCYVRKLRTPRALRYLNRRPFESAEMKNLGPVQ